MIYQSKINTKNNRESVRLDIYLLECELREAFEWRDKEKIWSLEKELQKKYLKYQELLLNCSVNK